MSTKPPIVCFVLDNDVKYFKMVKKRLSITKTFIDAIEKYTKNMYPTYNTIRIYAECIEHHGTSKKNRTSNDINIIQLPIYDSLIQQLCLIMKMAYLLKYIINPDINEEITNKTEIMYSQLYEYIKKKLDENCNKYFKNKIMNIKGMKKKTSEEKQECYDILINYIDKTINNPSSPMSKLLKKQYYIIKDICDSDKMTTIDDFNEEIGFISEILQDTVTSSIKLSLKTIYNYQNNENRLLFIIIKKSSFRVIQKAKDIYDDLNIDFHIINDLFDLKKLEKSESLKLINTHL
jgi:uncharacterized protein YoxC